MMPSPITWSSHFMMAGLPSRDDVPETAGLLTLHRGKVGITGETRISMLDQECWGKDASGHHAFKWCIIGSGKTPISIK